MPASSSDLSPSIEKGGYFDRANPFICEMVEPGHRNILEVGCGAAALGGSWKAVDPSRRVWGLEIDSEAAAMASARIDRLLQVDLDRLAALPEDAGHFDLITFGDILEHLRDPARLLECLIRYLAPGGEVIACVPNVSHWSVLSQLLQARFDYEDQGLLDRTHIHMFTPDTIKELLTASGLTAITAVVPVPLPGTLSEPLARLGAALAGAPDRMRQLQESFDTYQIVVRARAALRGTMTRFVVDASAEPEVAEQAVAAYRDGFRRGEPVGLTVLVGVNHPRFLETPAAPEGLTRPSVELLELGEDPGRPLELPPGPDRVVAVGDASAYRLPGAPACRPSRTGMLRAALLPTP